MPDLTSNEPPLYLRRRVSRPHPFATNDSQVVAPSPSKLTASEQKRIPKPLVDLYANFDARIAKAPPPFDWLRDALAGYERVVERARFDDREYWNLRLVKRFGDSLADGCFGCDAITEGTVDRSVPAPLAWARETFGTINLVAEQSGTAPFGRTLREVFARQRAFYAEAYAQQGIDSNTIEDVSTALPPESAAWVSLYETDGDWIFADTDRDETVWVGPEWTGEAATRFAVPWARAAAFVMWRMIDGGSIRPLDLRMLAARP